MSTIAAVDLGSNSFRLQLARVVDGELFLLDYLKGPARLAAGLSADAHLDADSQQRAIDCLARFGERLKGMPSHSVRAVGTNTWRIARDIDGFKARAEAALGYPIEIIAGREEARLIYIGAVNTLPPSTGRRLVVDIGGGSTEFIIGQGNVPSQLDSLQLGCVAYTRRFFPDGVITFEALERAVLSARAEVQRIVSAYGRPLWDEAVGTSGSARSLAEVLAGQQLGDGGISWQGLAQLPELMVACGHIDQLKLPGLRADRAPVLPGGYAIMAAIFAELGIEHMTMTLGALRDGVLYDLVGRQQHHDPRNQTVLELQRRLEGDAQQARRVQQWAQRLFLAFWPEGTLSPLEHEQALQQLAWAAKLHEVGFIIAHNHYHRHSAYIVQHADMPGFSMPEQQALAHLLLAQRGSLTKVEALLASTVAWTQVLALRLAVLCLRARREIDPPLFSVHRQGKSIVLDIDANWLAAHPQTVAALTDEEHFWAAVGRPLTVRSGL